MRTLRQARTKSTSLVSPAASSLVVKTAPPLTLTLPLTMTGDRSALRSRPSLCLLSKRRHPIRRRGRRRRRRAAESSASPGIAPNSECLVPRPAQFSLAEALVYNKIVDDRACETGTCFCLRDRGINHGRDARRSLTSEYYLGSRPSPELKSGEEMLNCRRSATSIRARYVQWAG